MSRGSQEGILCGAEKYNKGWLRSLPTSKSSKLESPCLLLSKFNGGKAEK